MQITGAHPDDFIGLDRAARAEAAWRDALAELIALPRNTAEVLQQPFKQLRPGVFQTKSIHLIPDKDDQKPLRRAIGLAIAESEGLAIEARQIQIEQKDGLLSVRFAPSYYGFDLNAGKAARDALDAVFDPEQQYRHSGSRSHAVRPSHRDTSGIPARTALLGCIKSALAWFEDLPRRLAWHVEFNAAQREYLTSQTRSTQVSKPTRARSKQPVADRVRTAMFGLHKDGLDYSTKTAVANRMGVGKSTLSKREATRAFEETLELLKNAPTQQEGPRKASTQTRLQGQKSRTEGEIG